MTASTAAKPEGTAVATMPERRSILMTMAHSYNMEPAAFEQTLRATVVPGNCSKEQFAAFLVVANEHQLNPLTKEIYAFPAKGGGIVPIVGVDGWIKLMNRRPEFEGIEFSERFDPKDGEILSVTATIHRKDRLLATQVTEYLEECRRKTDPWTQWPVRMLRHKAMIQCARIAFGFAGIVDEDEFERMAMVNVTNSAAPAAAPVPTARPTREKVKAELAAPQQTAKEPPPEEVEREADRLQQQAAARESGSGEAGEAAGDDGGEGDPAASDASGEAARPEFPKVSAKPTGAEARTLTEFVHAQLQACETGEDVSSFEAAYGPNIMALPSGLRRGTQMQITQRRVDINGGAS